MPARKPTATRTRSAPAKAKAKAKQPASTHPPKARSATMLRLTDKLRAICLALPDATEKEAWAEPTWRVNGKIFAMCDSNHHGSGHLSVWLPAPDGVQASLIESDPDRYFRPPYVGPKGWIGVVLDTKPDWGAVGSLIEIAHELIRSRRSRRR